MERSLIFSTLFLDIGGVLLTNGWSLDSRKSAAAFFDYPFSEMEERHHLVFVVFEEGKISLDDYLDRVLFYKQRHFTREAYTHYMFSRSAAFPEMIELISQVKKKYRLKIAVVSNEARELNAYRINTFRLNTVADFFISSCYVHLRKPDPAIFRLALDIAQVKKEEIIYIDDVGMFTEVATELGIQSIRHTDHSSTAAALAALGLKTG